LPDDAAFALGDVGGPPRGVEVVQGNGAVLDVGADLLCRPDQDGDMPGAAGSEQASEVGVGLGLVDEPDSLVRHAAADELVAEFGVDVPVLARGPQVAEHKLQ
jgi:hypothetical protein